MDFWCKFQRAYLLKVSVTFEKQQQHYKTTVNTFLANAGSISGTTLRGKIPESTISHFVWDAVLHLCVDWADAEGNGLDVDTGFYSAGHY